MIPEVGLPLGLEVTAHRAGVLIAEGRAVGPVAAAAAGQGQRLLAQRGSRPLGLGRLAVLVERRRRLGRRLEPGRLRRVHLGFALVAAAAAADATGAGLLLFLLVLEENAADVPDARHVPAPERSRVEGLVLGRRRLRGGVRLLRACARFFFCG